MKPKVSSKDLSLLNHWAWKNNTGPLLITVLNAAALLLTELDLQVTRGTEGYTPGGVEEGNCWALLVLKETDL